MVAKHCCEVLLLALFLFCQSALADAQDWSGYLNDKSVSGNTYGYMSTVSKSRPVSKLRVLCHFDGVSTLYFDEEIIDENTTTLSLTVDRLPVINLAVNRLGRKYEFSSQEPEFWKLIAQLVAGANLKIDSGTAQLHQYSLAGFTNSYLSNCGWSGGAKKYQQYLQHYR